MNKAKILKSLKLSESFLSGFEDDEDQGKSVRSILQKVRKSIKDLQDVDSHPICILDLNRSGSLPSFIDILEANEMAEYLDTNENMAEDLYSCEIGSQLAEKKVKLTSAQKAFVVEIESLMREKDCSYFRFI